MSDERELCISKVPGLKGTYLGLQGGSHFTALARFGSDEAVQDFTAWAKRSNGKIFHFDQEST